MLMMVLTQDHIVDSTYSHGQQPRAYDPSQDMVPHGSTSVVVLGGFFWFLRTTPFQNSKIFCCSLALETGSDNE